MPIIVLEVEKSGDDKKSPSSGPNAFINPELIALLKKQKPQLFVDSGSETESEIVTTKTNNSNLIPETGLEVIKPEPAILTTLTMELPCYYGDKTSQGFFGNLLAPEVNFAIEGNKDHPEIATLQIRECELSRPENLGDAVDKGFFRGLQSSLITQFFQKTLEGIGVDKESAKEQAKIAASGIMLATAATNPQTAMLAVILDLSSKYFSDSVKNEFAKTALSNMSLLAVLPNAISQNQLPKMVVETASFVAGKFVAEALLVPSISGIISSVQTQTEKENQIPSSKVGLKSVTSSESEEIADTKISGNSRVQQFKEALLARNPGLKLRNSNESSSH